MSEIIEMSSVEGIQARNAPLRSAYGPPFELQHQDAGTSGVANLRLVSNLDSALRAIRHP